MRGYSLTDMQNMLSFFNVKQSDCVLLHASLFNLGRVRSVSASDIPKLYVDFFLEHLNSGAFFCPTYSYDFPKTRLIDLGLPNSKMGNISNYMIEQERSYRSNHPMFSVVGMGTKAKKLLQPEKIEINPFSENSFFHRLKEEDGLVMILGVQHFAATFIIYCEFILGIKYRYLKPFKGHLFNSKTGLEYFGDFYHFVWPFKKNYENAYAQFQLELIEEGVIKEFSLGKGHVYAFRTQAFFNAISKLLSEKPFGLLTNKPDAFYEFINDQEVVISTNITNSD